MITDEMVERGLHAAEEASDARLPRHSVVRAILEAALGDMVLTGSSVRTVRDTAPAGSGEVHPIPQELFDRAHRLRELAAANRLNECLPTIETMCGKNAGDAIRDAAALLRKLQQGAE